MKTGFHVSDQSPNYVGLQGLPRCPDELQHRGGTSEVLQASLSCLGDICRTLGLGLARTVKRTFQGKMDHMGPLAEKLDPVPCSASDFPCGFGDGKSSDLLLPILRSKDWSTACLCV